MDDQKAIWPEVEFGHAGHHRPTPCHRLPYWGVLALRWTDIDLSATPPTVAISGTIKTETGKGTYRKSKPKSDASKRTIALPPFAVAVLMRRRVEQPPNRHDAVFATRNGTWHQVGNIERRWRTIRADAGLDWVTPHTFRKTVATMIDRLVDSDTAARVLGHSSSAITKEYYIEKDRSAPHVTHLLQSLPAGRRRPRRPSESANCAKGPQDRTSAELVRPMQSRSCDRVFGT
jgi:integrase